MSYTMSGDINAMLKAWYPREYMYWVVSGQAPAHFRIPRPKDLPDSMWRYAEAARAQTYYRNGAALCALISWLTT